MFNPDFGSSLRTLVPVRSGLREKVVIDDIAVQLDKLENRVAAYRDLNYAFTDEVFQVE